MIYNDGYPMNEDLRVLRCPKCKNEEMGEDAEYCRICGSPLFNLCEGEEIYDFNGNYEGLEQHKNFGNARFCEKCGKPTTYLKLKFLVPFNEFQQTNDDDNVPF